MQNILRIHGTGSTGSPARGVVAVTIAAAVSLGGCNASVPIESTFPVPLVETLPVSVGVHYDDQFRNFSHSEKTKDGLNWTISMGQANVRLFSRVMDSMFSEVVTVEAVAVPTGDLAAVIKPAVEEFAFLTPAESGSEFFAVSIRYRIEVYRPDGTLSATWPVNSYGKTRGRLLGNKQSLAEATEMAMRDAAAALAVDLQKRPQITSLVNQEAGAP